MRSLRRLARIVSVFALTLLPATPGIAQETDAELPTIEETTEGMTRLDGFIPLYWDAEAEEMHLEISIFDTDLLHYVSLPAGLGQNDLGLNRGDLGPQQVVRFRRTGKRIMLIEPNYRFRAVSDDPLEVKSVDDGFPTSVHWGFEIEARTGDRYLVDATGFFMRDAFGLARRLESQGSFRLEASRSSFFEPRTRNFPDNTEVELEMTFVANSAGGTLNSVTPTGTALTVRQHHSFVRLPAIDDFEMRAYDPRAGFFGTSWYDFATPIQEPLQKRLINRHRLEKQDPTAAMSAPVEPIIYYLDPGTPEPVRTALIEGGNWWNEAFEAAGFIDAFRVEMLPADADPMDVRYNVIQWVHRSTRGWSYGNSVSDPRTGEILKGHVTLGSLRVRQDYLLGEGLTAPYVNGDEDPPEILEMSLHRIRQLSAHEIGHTIGLAHNYISSAQRHAGNQSVMDYPHPRTTIGSDGAIHLDDAYDSGIGRWDEIAIRYGYSDFPEGADEAAALEAILQEGIAEGTTFRPNEGVHPETGLWDNGSDLAAELNRMIDVRRIALDRFGERAIRSGEPMAMMEDVFVPLYLHHRYQVEAAANILGGQYYTYALRGDGQRPVRPVPADEQRAALDALLRTLDPAELAVPASVRDHLPPRPGGYLGGNELFGGWTGPVFDAIAPAATAAEITVSQILDRTRAARLVQQHALDPALPGLDDVLADLEASVFATASDPYHRALRRVTRTVYVDALIDLASGNTMPQVQALAMLRLRDLRDAQEAVAAGGSEDRDEAAHGYLLARRIDAALNRPLPAATPAPPAPNAPPGSPIGDPGRSGTAGGWSLDGRLDGPLDDGSPLSGLLDSAAPLTCSWG
ncbi:MAG: zinc-dependent metalloprotease [Longimicrobiales bacterium]|nr:zinc-dependent metalloprotease [Longimicrobiales bacterium]